MRSPSRSAKLVSTVSGGVKAGRLREAASAALDLDSARLGPKRRTVCRSSCSSSDSWLSLLKAS